MRGLIFDPEQSDARIVATLDLADPLPGGNDIIVEVAYAGVSRFGRDCSRASKAMALGQDFSGIVVAPALNGSGPEVGARVLGWVPFGACAERLAVDVNQSSCIPESLDLVDAVLLPSIGLLAHKLLEPIGGLLGKHLLVVGAESRVGQLVCQMGLCMGASVSSIVSKHANKRSVAMHGVDNVLLPEDLSKDDRSGSKYDAVIDLHPLLRGHLQRSVLVEGGTYSLLRSKQRAEAVSVANIAPSILNGAVFHTDADAPPTPVVGRIADVLRRLLNKVSTGSISLPQCRHIGLSKVGKHRSSAEFWQDEHVVVQIGS